MLIIILRVCVPVWAQHISVGRCRHLAILHSVALPPYEVLSRVGFNESNVVTKLGRGGQAQRDGLIRVGDTVIAVEGDPLEGERVSTALNKEKKIKCELHATGLLCQTP